MKLYAIEGNRFSLDGGSMFGNAPKVLWSQWIKPDEQNRIRLASRALLIHTNNGLNILFETGVGAFFEPKFKARYSIDEEDSVLLENLSKVGLNERDIDAVVLSHLHFDHAGGLLTPYEKAPQKLLFPEAQFFIGKQHWERALRPHIREQASFIPGLITLLIESKRLNLIEDSSLQIGDLNIKMHYSHGHTLGLMLAEINTSEGPLIYASDLVPGLPWIHLPIAMGYDRFPEQTINEKKTLLDYLIMSNGRLFFTHDLNDHGAYVKKEEDRYIALPFQLSKF